MKNLLYTLLFISMSLTSFSAEVLVQDSVETGPTYKNDVFYSLHNTNNTVTADAKEWDIAFEIIGAGYSILSNDGWGVQVYHKKGMTAEDFANTIDVEDVKANWKQLYNSTETWTVGAFISNKDPENDFDLGWGEYSQATHSVYATTFYVVKTMSGKWKKLMIDDLTARIYTFTIANLDGTESVVRTIKKDDFLNRNFAYFSIDNDKSLDREPVIADWDITFGKYINMEGDNKDTPYPVTGVRTNPKISSIRVGNSNPATVAVPNGDLFNDNITNIGSNWKRFDGTKFVVSDTLAFFLYRFETQKTFRLIFNGFGGSASGKYLFKHSEVATSVSDNETGNKFSLSVYPNVVSKGENVNLLTSIEQNDNAIFEVYSSEGVLVWKSDFSSESNFSSINLPTNNLSSGMYLVSLRNRLGRATQKLIVE
jgi:hypothetical protein